jgi:hypothetical protein
MMHDAEGLDLNYLEHMEHRLAGKEEFVPSSYGDKRKVRRVASMLGIRTSAIYFDGKLSDLEWSKLPDEFVIKPSFASTSIGVYLIQRQADGTYRNLLSGDSVDPVVIEDHLRSISDRFLKDQDAGTFLVEELLRDEQGQTPPKDIRLYSFFGKVGLVIVEDHLTNSYAEAMYFDGDFEPFSDIRARYGIAPKASHLERTADAVRPLNARTLLSAAERISASVPTAFCRVDLYNTPKGVYLGEITFYPGTFYYKDRKIMHDIEADRLGRIWDDAAYRLSLSDLIDSK